MENIVNAMRYCLSVMRRSSSKPYSWNNISDMKQILSLYTLTLAFPMLDLSRKLKGQPRDEVPVEFPQESFLVQWFHKLFEVNNSTYLLLPCRLELASLSHAYVGVVCGMHCDWDGRSGLQAVPMEG